jgi:hypothetical protein
VLPKLDLRPWRLVLLALTLAFAGCAALPNTQPFTDATVSLKSAVASSGAAVLTEMHASPLLADQTAPQSAKAQDLTKQFESAWAARNQAMAALVAYAQSVQAVTESGNHGEEAAKKLTEAAQNLTSALGAAWPSANTAAGVLLDAGQFAFGELARLRAAKSLEASLAQTQPFVENIAAIFVADLRSADRLVTDVIDTERDALFRRNRTELAYRQRLLDTQRLLQAEIGNQLLPDPKTGQPATPPSKLTGADELSRIAALQAQQDAWWSGYQQQDAALAARAKAAHALLAETQAAFDAWAAAHAQLLAAVRAKRAPGTAELLAAVGRIHGLVERYRAL